MCIKHFPPFLNHYNSVKKSEKLYFSQELKKKKEDNLHYRVSIIQAGY